MGESNHALKAFMVWTNIRFALRDHNLLDEEIRKTQLDWTLVRASRLDYYDAKEQNAGGVRTLNAQGAGTGISDSCSVSGAARFPVKVAVDRSYVKEAVVIRD